MQYVIPSHLKVFQWHRYLYSWSLPSVTLTTYFPLLMKGISTTLLVASSRGRKVISTKSYFTYQVQKLHSNYPIIVRSAEVVVVVIVRSADVRSRITHLCGE